MSNYILRPEKLAKLPSDLQRAISSLDTTQLSYLQAAFSNHDYFDFFALPLELRIMIYRLVFDNGCNTIIVKNSTGYELKQRKKEGRDLPFAGLQLLTVNKQVHAEAISALKEVKTAFLPIRYNLQISQLQKIALRAFSHFVFSIPVHREGLIGNSASEHRKLLLRALQQIPKVRKSGARSRPMSIKVRFYTGWDRRNTQQDINIEHSPGKKTMHANEPPDTQQLRMFFDKFCEQAVTRLTQASLRAQWVMHCMV